MKILILLFCMLIMIFIMTVLLITLTSIKWCLIKLQSLIYKYLTGTEDDKI